MTHDLRTSIYTEPRTLRRMFENIGHRLESSRTAGGEQQSKRTQCSSLWKKMTDEEKQKYQKMAEDDRDRYQREVTGYMKPLAKDGTRRGRKKKEPGQPKRNMLV